MTDPDDPLRGLDPYPRERIDGLRQERADLLEEIVSTPGPGRTPTPARTKVLLTVGIAAALAIVGGGAWFVASGPNDTVDDRTVAASASHSSGPAPATDEPTAPDTATTADDVRANGVHLGRVLSARECRRIVSGRTRLSELRSSLELLSRVRPRLLERQRRGDAVLHIVRRHGKVLVVDRQCRVLRLDDRPRADR